MERKNKILILVVVFILAVLIAIFLFPEREEFEKVKVIEVIDGDTFIIENSYYVRLIGADAPEKNHSFYNLSKNFLSYLILNKTIELERDIKNKDKYGRLLRYVFVNETFVNYEIVRKGYAFPLFIEPNLKYKLRIEEAGNFCLKERNNLCKTKFS